MLRPVSVVAVITALMGSPACDEDVTGNECAVEPTLSSIQEEVFKIGCVFDDCHNSREAEGDMDLESAGLHARLVNATPANEAAAAEGKLLVIPGNPDDSFLIQKLEGRIEFGDDAEGELMPDGATKPVSPLCRIKMLRQWISDGALDN